MTIAAVLGLVATYGPSIIPLIQKLVADVEAGKGNQTVTSADLAELAALANQTGADVYKKAGIALPPAA